LTDVKKKQGVVLLPVLAKCLHKTETYDLQPFKEGKICAIRRTKRLIAEVSAFLESRIYVTPGFDCSVPISAG